MRAMAELVASFRNDEEKIREGGGAKAIEAQHKKKRLTARQRIALLLDPGSELSSSASSLRTACTKSGAARRRRA